MGFVIMGVSSDSEDALEDAEGDADTLFDAGGCTEVDVGDAAIVPSTTGCYELHFDTSLDTSTYNIDITGLDYIVVFTEHFPTEFEYDTHFLLTAAGDDVEATHTHPEAGDDDHAGHDHGGSEAYEWAGIFDVSDSAPTNVVQWVSAAGSECMIDRDSDVTTRGCGDVTTHHMSHRQRQRQRHHPHRQRQRQHQPPPFSRTRSPRRSTAPTRTQR